MSPIIKEVIVMTWKEIQISDVFLLDGKTFMIKKFSELYPFEKRNDETLFYLPDGYKMHIVIMRGNNFNCLVMNYKSSTDDDDGDIFYPNDYSNPEEMFKYMLEETRR